MVDGALAFIPRHPFGLNAPAVSSNVPVLVGTTKNEGTYYTIHDSFHGVINEKDLPRQIDAHW